MRLNQSREGEAAQGNGLRTHVIVSSASSSHMLDLEEGEKLLIGRSPDVQISVDDPLVSRLHAQIERRSGSVFIQDRGSANGTWVNGRSCDGEVMIRTGDEVKIGATVLTIVETSPPPEYHRDILTPEKLMDRFDHELVRSRQDGEPLVLVLVLPGRIPAPLDLLQRRLLDLMGAGDSFGHGPDGELLLLKPGDSRTHAEMRVRKLVEKTVESNVSVHGIGIAVFPDDGMKSGALIDAARLAADDRDWRRMSRPPCPVEPLSRSVTLVDGVSTQPDTDKEFIVGDPAMLNLMKTARKVAMSDAPVLVTGETGVGKEILARYIHRASNRANGPLVKVNCAALPPALIEAELFGHEKGAFTGADERRVGFLESANLGTVILDEITELPGSVQVKLLRFLDDYTINRVGMTEEVLLDVRVIALTNRDVEEEIRIGSFRQDLFYRLGTFHLYIPPLRSRTVDIPLLAEYFARKVAQRFEMETPTLGSRFIERLKSHSWPGNVRELRNAMESAVIHCEGDRLTSQHVPVTITSKVTIDGQDSPVQGKMKQRKAEAEAEEISKALAATGGVQKAAAEILGISRRTLWSKIKQYGIEIKKGG